MNRLSHFLQRARVAYHETGVQGLARRTTRVGLAGLRAQLGELEHRLYYSEATARRGEMARRAAAETAAMRDSRRGQRAFIMATGPSINDPSLDLGRLRDEVTIGVNSFYLHPIIQQWQPTYMAMMDYALFINGSMTDDFFSAMRSAVPRSEYFLPAQFLPEVQQHGWLPLERVHGIPMDGDFCEYDWQEINMHLLPSTPNVLMFSLAIAIHLGCSPIVLLGADNSWLARPLKNRELLDHFYGQKGFTFPKAAKTVEFQDYHDVIHYCDRLWRGYKTLRRIAEQRGIQVINATPGSYLDVFPMATLDEVLERSRARSGPAT